MLAKGPRLLNDEANGEFLDETQEMYDQRIAADLQQKYGNPNKDFKELLKESGVEDLSKIEEQKIDADTFWEIEADKLAETLKIEDFIVKQTLTEAFKKIKQNHATEVEQKEFESKNLTIEDRKAMNQLLVE